MIKTIFREIKQIEKPILNIMFIGIKFSSIICLISTFILFIYKINPISYITYQSGLIIFKTSLTFAIEFIICGFAVNTIRKQI